MPQVIVTTTGDEPRFVLLDEQVSEAHLSNEHSAAQLIERLGWAISDAEDTEQAERALLHR
jgi:hypothetical protein